ncbi:trehalose synthase [bacterium]|nr:trehalose synthase [bacterium]MCI0566363.1 trehalose synthase [bacterium]MCI0680124.1 trehalose synthase [bacterium]
METNWWWKNAKIYELYIDKFAGDLKGITERLPYFNALGINCLHILPHYKSPMIDDGYDVSNYRSVRPELGTLDDFREFVVRAKEKNVRVITDLVLNHSSESHPWFVEARSSKTNDKRDYFLWSETGTEYAEARNVFPHLKPRNWVWNEATHDYYFATFYAEQPDFNWTNPRVLEEILAIMDFWIEMGVDGFRLDAAPYLVKKEGTLCRNLPETHEILKKIRAHLNEKAPHVALLTEVHDTPKNVREYFGNGDECHLMYHFGMAEKFFLAAIKNDPSIAARAMEANPSIPENCSWALFTRNHDQLSFVTLSPDEQKEILEYVNPVDQDVFLEGTSGITSTGLSMRTAEIFKNDPEKIRNIFRIFLGTPGAPIIYYGEEIGMRNDEAIGKQADTRRYVRGQFDWTLAEKEMGDPNSLFSFVAGLLRARNT